MAHSLALSLLLSTGLLPGAASAPPSAQSAGSSTTTYSALAQGHRILLLFSSSTTDARRVEQLKGLAVHGDEASERDLVIVAIPGPAPFPLIHTLPSREESATRQRFKVSPSEFAMVLVGKDGGEKHRWSAPVSFQAIRSLIDDMPMRKEEMKSKASKGLHR